MDLSELNAASGHRHPWEISRFECISKILLANSSRRFLDFGAGDLYVARGLRERGGAEVVAVDAHFDAEAREPGLTTYRSLEATGGASFPKVFALDVLEHLDDDVGAFKTLVEKLEPGGELLVTVPAHPKLFSAHDVALKHRRRYTMETLAKLAERTPTVRTELFYFYFIPFMVRSLSLKLGGGQAGEVAGWRFSRRHPLTVFFVALLNVDYWVSRTLARLGLHLPGLSLCLRCQKT